MNGYRSPGDNFRESYNGIVVRARSHPASCRIRPQLVERVSTGSAIPALRRRTNAGLNKGEAHHALKRAVFFRRLGEIRDRTFENQCYRASGLNLAVAAIILWNTVYLGRAVDELRSRGEILPDELLAHVAPLGWERIAFNGDYVWPATPLGNAFRPLRNPRAEFLEAA